MKIHAIRRKCQRTTGHVVVDNHKCSFHSLFFIDLSCVDQSRFCFENQCYLAFLWQEVCVVYAPLLSIDMCLWIDEIDWLKQEHNWWECNLGGCSRMKHVVACFHCVTYRGRKYWYVWYKWHYVDLMILFVVTLPPQDVSNLAAGSLEDKNGIDYSTELIASGFEWIGNRIGCIARARCFYGTKRRIVELFTGVNWVVRLNNFIATKWKEAWNCWFSPIKWWIG